MVLRYVSGEQTRLSMYRECACGIETAYHSRRCGPLWITRPVQSPRAFWTVFMVVYVVALYLLWLGIARACGLLAVTSVASCGV
jgi:hypothetical protein